MNLVSNGLHTFATHHATNATDNQQHNVVEHLGKGLVHWRHRLQWLSHEGQAVKHERYDSRQDERHDNDDKTPSPDFKFFSGQTRLVVLVGQFVSPIQGRLSNQGNLE